MVLHDVGAPAMETYFADYTVVSIEYSIQFLKKKKKNIWVKR